MGEEGVEQKERRPLNVDGTAGNYTSTQTAAQLGPVPWTAAPTLPKPKIPVSLSKGMKSADDDVVITMVDSRAQWNTSRLGLRVGVDAVAAASSAVLVAPIVSMIDKGIMENASGRRTLGESLKSSTSELLTKPWRFLGSKPFGLIFCLYFGTYFTANSIDTVSSTIRHTRASSTTAGTSKFVATSTANLALCLYKDNRFTKLFGSTSPRPVPPTTFALFIVRDCLTIFASFNLPPLLAPHVESHLSSEVKKYVGAASVAQFVTPAAVQIFSTPLHLLGLDLYNRSGVGVFGVDGRTRRVVRDWAKSAVARMGRIVPAFGVGGVVNTKVRGGLMGKLE